MTVGHRRRPRGWVDDAGRPVRRCSASLAPQIGRLCRRGDDPRWRGPGNLSVPWRVSGRLAITREGRIANSCNSPCRGRPSRPWGAPADRSQWVQPFSGHRSGHGTAGHGRFRTVTVGPRHGPLTLENRRLGRLRSPAARRQREFKSHRHRHATHRQPAIQMLATFPQSTGLRARRPHPSGGPAVAEWSQRLGRLGFEEKH